MPTVTTTSLLPFATHFLHYPRTYVAPRVSFPGLNKIDGDLTKEVWSAAPWSDEFDDIRGAEDAPPADRPRPTCRTRFKMLWDDTYLYIGALLTSDMETVASFKERNSPIFQMDSDFEVFVDPLGSCHNYKELELNALNTVWNLMLDRPYNDGGVEHSGRVAKPGEKLYYDAFGQKTATRVLEGTLNDPNGSHTTWSVEIAFAHKDTLSNIINARDGKPDVGTQWRINFSRVEKRGDINWTWQAQKVWDTEQRRYRGFVNMHLPDAWGYLVFGDRHGNTTAVRDPTWPPRLAAMNIYYAQHQYFNETGSFASEMKQLAHLIDAEAVEPFDVEIRGRSRFDGSNGFIVVVKGNPDGSIVTVTDDRHVEVQSHELPKTKTN